MTTEGKTDLAGLPEKWRKQSRHIHGEHVEDVTGAQSWSRGASEALAICADELAAALVQGETQGWQPIATAPKDGTRILIRQGICAPVHASWKDSGWQIVEYDGPQRPTHWMPLPAAAHGRDAAMNEPIDIDKGNWLYIDTDGLALIHESRDVGGRLLRTEQIVIPWLKVRAALARHDRKKPPRGFAPTGETP